MMDREQVEAINPRYSLRPKTARELRDTTLAAIDGRDRLREALRDILDVWDRGVDPPTRIGKIARAALEADDADS